MFSTPRAIQSPYSLVNLKFPCRPHCIRIQIHCVGSYKALKMLNNMVLLDISHWLNQVIEHKWNVWCVTLSTIYFYTVTEFVKIAFGLAHNTQPTLTRTTICSMLTLRYVCACVVNENIRFNIFECVDVYCHISIQSRRKYHLVEQVSEPFLWDTVSFLRSSLSCFRSLPKKHNLPVAYYMVLILNDP